LYTVKTLVTVGAVAKLVGTNCSTAVDCCFCSDYVPHSSCVDQRCQCDAGYNANQLLTACLPRAFFQSINQSIKDWVCQIWRDQCVVDGEKPEVDSRDEGKHAGRSYLLFTEKTM